MRSIGSRCPELPSSKWLCASGIAWLVFSVFYSTNVLASDAFLSRQAVRDYIDKISQEHDLNPAAVTQLFAEAKPQQSVLDAISKPAERVLTWAQYRPIFIKQKRIDAGVAFMQQNASDLQRAEDTYGVPANVIAAIIGVETFYGKITGKHPVLDSVATLAFDYPKRATFFKRELTEYLVLAMAEGWDAGTIKGSYAGAMGWPQFISSSYRQYAVDFDGDGQRDLFNSVPDVIGSVANYLAVHGWQSEAPIAQEILPSDLNAKKRTALNSLIRKSLKPAIAPETLENIGIEVAGDQLVRVMQFAGSGGEELWVGYKNFYVITRYNHSALYALAVYQLSEELAGSIQ